MYRQSPIVPDDQVDTAQKGASVDVPRTVRVVMLGIAAQFTVGYTAPNNCLKAINFQL